ncbi:hypothetical protein P3T26_007549 [Streptomyces sp. MAA16]|nr:hypothetical protein [Streptomyces sp. MAA16]
MSESTTVATGLTSQYIAQVAGDLESNLKEQERISAEIAALQEQLTALQQDHSVLVNVQQALGVTHGTNWASGHGRQRRSALSPAEDRGRAPQQTTGKEDHGPAGNDGREACHAQGRHDEGPAHPGGTHPPSPR